MHAVYILSHGTKTSVGKEGAYYKESGARAKATFACWAQLLLLMGIVCILIVHPMGADRFTWVGEVDVSLVDSRPYNPMGFMF
jgi:hypothetical protein